MEDIAVCDISKIRNVVNSQHILNIIQREQGCLRYIKDTKCSQFTTTVVTFLRYATLFAIYQRYSGKY